MNSSKKRLYIAYGSNLNLEQMRHRCPAAEVVGKSTLHGWRLRFRGGAHSAVATIEQNKDFSVPALVWRIQPDDELALDRYEGFPFLYRKEMLRVPIDGKRVCAMVYIMNEAGHPYGLPSVGYYNTIFQGYQNARFDTEILRQAAEDSRGSHMDEVVRGQIMAIRDTGEINMLDTRTVQRIANREGFYELVVYLEEHRREYANFILTGKE